MPGLEPPRLSCLDFKVPGSPGPVVQVAPQEEAWVSWAVPDPGCGHRHFRGLGQCLAGNGGGMSLGGEVNARQGPPVAWRCLGSRSGQSRARSFLGGPALCRQAPSPGSPAADSEEQGVTCELRLEPSARSMDPAGPMPSCLWGGVCPSHSPQPGSLASHHALSCPPKTHSTLEPVLSTLPIPGDSTALLSCG